MTSRWTCSTHAGLNRCHEIGPSIARLQATVFHEIDNYCRPQSARLLPDETDNGGKNIHSPVSVDNLFPDKHIPPYNRQDRKQSGAGKSVHSA